MGILTDGSAIQDLVQDIGTSKMDHEAKFNGTDLTPGRKALDMVSKLGPSHGFADEHCWNLTSPQLASMLEEASYPVERQVEILLFYYHWIVCCRLPISRRY